MAGPIQTIPQGLLGLLQLKELGVNPGQLLDNVQPSMDILGLYLQRNMQNSAGLFGSTMTTSALANGNHGLQGFVPVATPAVLCQVPQNEVWWVQHFSMDIQTQNAADFISAAQAILYQAGGRSNLVAPLSADVVSARVRSWQGAPIVQPFWAGPGCTFGCYVFDILAGTTLTVTGDMRATRIPI